MHIAGRRKSGSGPGVQKRASSESVRGSESAPLRVLSVGRTAKRPANAVRRTYKGEKERNISLFAVYSAMFVSVPEKPLPVWIGAYSSPPVA